MNWKLFTFIIDIIYQNSVKKPGIEQGGQIQNSNFNHKNGGAGIEGSAESIHNIKFHSSYRNTKMLYQRKEIPKSKLYL